ncbi:hypothetical protein [Nocardia coubleae]|nr:hypothetical protein [Nocardia coubleae]
MWEARFATTAAAKGWEELCRAARASTWEAWIVLTERPTMPENPSRQAKLKGALSTHIVGGVTFDQWQYEVTGGGRVWYCPDETARVVWIVAAGPAHPKATD